MKKKVMLVDDNDDLRFSVIAGLNDLSADFEIIEADLA